MNERIRELAEQAGITTNLDTNYFEKDMNKWVDYFSEKFAELIVQETIKQMAIQMDKFGDDQSNNPAWYKSEETVKKQLRVKE